MTARDIHNEVMENAAAVAATNGSNSIPHAPCSVGKAIPRNLMGRAAVDDLILARLAPAVPGNVCDGDVINTILDDTAAYKMIQITNLKQCPTN